MTTHLPPARVYRPCSTPASGCEGLRGPTGPTCAPEKPAAPLRKSPKFARKARRPLPTGAEGSTWVVPLTRREKEMFLNKAIGPRELSRSPVGPEPGGAGARRGCAAAVLYICKVPRHEHKRGNTNNAKRQDRIDPLSTLCTKLHRKPRDPEVIHVHTWIFQLCRMSAFS